MNSGTLNDFLRMEIKNEAGILPKNKIKSIKSLDLTKSLQEIHGGTRNMLQTITNMQAAKSSIQKVLQDK